MGKGHRKTSKVRKIAVTYNFMNDPVFAHVLVFGLSMVAFTTIQDEGLTDANKLWGLLASGVLVAYVIYLVLWILGRRGNMEMEFRKAEVYLPPTNLRVSGVTIPYTDIRNVALTRRGRAVRIRWKWGWITYGRDCLPRSGPGNVAAMIGDRIPRP